MVPSIRVLLLGTPQTSPWYLELLVVVPLFGLVFALYAVDVFAVAGGVVFVPGEAALVGFLVAATLAVLGRGPLFAWLTLYAALLGYAADHYLLGLSGRPVPERVAALVEPDGLVALAVLAVLLGTVAWLAGELGRRGVEAARAHRVVDDAG